MTTKIPSPVIEELLSAKTDWRFTDLLLNGQPILPYPFAKKHRLIPFEETQHEVFIAITAPVDYEVLEDIRFKLKKEVLCFQKPQDQIDQAIETCYHKGAGVLNEVKDQKEDIDAIEGYDLLDQQNATGIIRIADSILLEAIGQKASDIHFEPQENSLEVRFRLDGVLHLCKTVQKNQQDELITRLKVLSKLDIAENRLPQDGRMKLSIGERQIDFRVSTVPVVFGERMVLRILDKKNIHLGLDAIGLPQDVLSSLKNILTKTQGILLVTGPTGSGKTTTLYSALKELQSTSVNIMTIEDPVEYKLSHMAQIGVNHKINLSFSTGLRHILRQDPDVIMVGEIRDKETAEIAIQASLTGHLVLSTLHTNDALSAPARLVDMGIEPFLISSSLIAVLAQRLVRVICPHCKENYEPSIEEIKDLGLVFCDQKLSRGRGCSECFGFGYKGRLGIYELLIMNGQLKSLLHQEHDPVKRLQLAQKEGFITLREQGVRRVLEGVTTVEEIIRVTGKGDL